MWTMESFLLAAQGSPSLPHLPRCSAHTPSARRCGRHNNSSKQHSSNSLSSTSLCRTPRAAEDDRRRQRHGSRHAARMRTSVADRPQVTAADGRFLKWLEGQAAPIEKVSIRSQHRAGEDIDMTVAAVPLNPGDIALRIPERLVVTLSSVFEDDTVAELLTCNKLSELACLTLYMMYEKLRGKESRWYEYIKELDKQRGRGQQGAKSPLLWDAGQVEELLQGSPVGKAVGLRLKGIQREYDELDTVWFMGGSLFKNYPYDIPTEAFSFEIFKQAFAAIQSSVVHLQGVPLSRRFALVPLGPPLLSYSPTAKASLKYEPESREVTLAVDRSYSPGDAIVAWCGPQPNSRLLINYGIVAEENPYDRLQLTATIGSSDPLFQQKRALLQRHNLATQQSFDIYVDRPLPAMLLPYCRLAHATDEADLQRPGLLDTAEGGEPPAISPQNEHAVVQQLLQYFQRRLKGYRTSIAEDEAIIADETLGPRPRVAARLLRIEKRILEGALQQVQQHPEAEVSATRLASAWPATISLA